MSADARLNGVRLLDAGKTPAAPPYAAEEPAPRPRPDGLPKGFDLRDSGVYRREDDADGKATWVWVCSPLLVIALTRDGGGDGWGRLVEVTDPDGRAHRWVLIGAQ